MNQWMTIDVTLPVRIAELGETLKYVGLALLNSGAEWTAATEFDAHWRHVAPPSLPVWGVGSEDNEGFVQFLIYCRYLESWPDAFGRAHFRPTLALKLTLAIAFPLTLTCYWPSHGDWALQL